ncbi:hypothetical protein K3495_g7660 [Podosphaera aphanis]|nr:hypothetical protein K3495_g7660 [Podosphaera aphanis]
MIAYSNTSWLESNLCTKVGGGVVIYQAGQVISKNCIPLSPSLGTFDAEAFSALQAIDTALLLPSARFTNNLWSFSDNLDVARRLCSILACSSQESFLKFATRASEWPHRSRLPHTIPGEVYIRWIPSHAGIKRNVLADKATKGALNSAPPLIHLPSLVSAKSWAKVARRTAVKYYWDQHISLNYRNLHIGFLEECPGELSLPRPLKAHIHAARSGHGEFAPTMSDLATKKPTHTVVVTPSRP